MQHFWLYILLAAAGHVFYLLKQQLENVKRQQKFDGQTFLLSEGMNIIAIPTLIYLGIQVPTDWLTMSPITALMIGSFGSSLLSGLINTRKPKDDDTETTTLTTTLIKPTSSKEGEL